MRPNLAPQEIDKTLHAVFLKDAEAVHVIKTVGNTRGLKERHCLHVLHHAVVRFRQKGDVDRPVPGGGMIEAELVSEDRLARPWLAPHDVNACFEKASSQNDVEARDAGGHPMKWRLPVRIDWIGRHGTLRWRKRKDHSEGRSFGGAAGHADLAMHGIHKLADHPEANAETALLAPGHRALESIEDAGLVFFRDTDPVIPNDQ